MDNDKTLNKEQLAAVVHKKGPLLIIAGAGTGKTTVITERIKYLILTKNVSPTNILALTFTEKASREMEERVDIALPYGYSQMWISTFHSFCDRVLRAEAIHIGLNPSYRLMTEAETVLFLRKNLFSFNLSYFRPLGNPNKFLEALLHHFSRLKDEDISPSEYLKYSKILKAKNEEKGKTNELAYAYKMYEELKTKENVMDFSDLISNALLLLRVRPNILSAYQEKFKYILVDEFQDTNYAQNELAILLAGKKQNITVVGDDDQAIYRWRGAAISNILQFKKHFPKTKIVVLTKNYRSTQEILDHSYKLIQFNNPDRLETKEGIDKKLVGMRKIKGQAPVLIYEDRVENEADKTAREIKKLLKENKNYLLKDIAILVRANDHARTFTRALERHNIPYQFLGPGQLFQQEEIKNLIAYLKILYNFEDSVSLYRVLSMENFGIDARSLAAILNFARRKNLTLFEAIEKVDEVVIPDTIKEKVSFIFSLINKHLKRAKKDTAGQILYYFLEDSGLLKEIFNYKTRKTEKEAQNMAKLFDKLKTYEVEHDDASVSSVVDWIDLSMQMGESPLATDVDWSQNNAVNILTVHSSKGLEFPVVFIVNLVRDRFPTRERHEQIPIPEVLIKEILPLGDYHLEEERRLFYVAMTRAKDRLFITASNYYGEGKRERKLSPFVYETLGDKISEQSRNEKDIQLALLEWGEKENIEKKQEKEKPQKTIIDYLSYSQIETFKTCPLHFKAKYILKIPVPQTSAQSFGTSIHTTLRDYYLEIMKGQKINTGELVSLLKRNWINEGYVSKSHEKKMFEHGQEILKSFNKNFKDKGKPLCAEFPFIFKIAKDNRILKIGGRIDRIDKLRNGKIQIIDYKTGSNEPKEKDLEKHLQLTIYALATTNVPDVKFSKKPEDIVLSLYFLESGNKYETTRTKEDLGKATEEIFKIADGITISDFICSGRRICANCEYKMLCRV